MDRPLTVGGPGSDLVFADAAMSSPQVRLTPDGDVVVFEDLGSERGLWLGTERIQQRRVVPGATVYVGGASLTVLDTAQSPAVAPSGPSGPSPEAWDPPGAALTGAPPPGGQDPPGPGWWMASDGNWYPPSASPGPAAGWGTPAGYGRFVPETDKGARNSLILAIVGLFICPIIFSVGAIIEGAKAKTRIADSQGRLTGEGMAQAGVIVGIIGIAFGLLFLAITLS